MSNRAESRKIEKETVVTMAYSLTSEGEIIDSTEDGESLVFIQGFGSIIPGLEQQLYGMVEGEKKNIFVTHQDAYGTYDVDQIVPIPLSEFPDELDLEPGLVLEMKDNDGDIVFAKVVSIGKSRVKMDFNHPLAGIDLDFEVSILALREATTTELEQGFVD